MRAQTQIALAAITEATYRENALALLIKLGASVKIKGKTAPPRSGGGMPQLEMITLHLGKITDKYLIHFMASRPLQTGTASTFCDALNNTS